MQKSGCRRNLYFKNDIWDSISGAARSQGRTVSNYLANLHIQMQGGEDNEKPAQVEKFNSRKVEKKSGISEETKKKIALKSEYINYDPFFNPRPKKGKK